MELKLDDYVSGGSRSELKLPVSERLNHLSKYSFRFLLPEDFFATDEGPGHIILHQWHDMPDPGFNWRTQNKVTNPPVYLFVDRKDGGQYDLIFRTGLVTGEMNETITSVWKGDLLPNKWYTFSCEVFWHLYTDEAYVLPMLDGEYFYTSKGQHKIYRRNLYNSLGNYLKFGIYKFGNEKHDKFVYFDDIQLESEIIKCN